MVVSPKSKRKMSQQKGTRRSSSRRPNFSSAEIEAIVSFMEARKDLEYGELSGRYADVRMTYDELTAVVNSVNGSLKVERTASEVKDKWMCFKYRTKKKAQAIVAKRSAGGSEATSASACPWDTLSPLEERVVELIGRDVVYANYPDSPSSDSVKGHASGSQRGRHNSRTASSHLSNGEVKVKDSVEGHASGRKRGRHNSRTAPSHLSNGEVQVKIEPVFDTSSAERVHPHFTNPVPSPPSQCSPSPTTTTNVLLRSLMDQHRLMLESLTNFQESLDTHNKIQRGIMCMKYMKLKLLADERNVEVVLPAELESLLAATNDD